MSVGDWNDLMPHTITVAELSGRDGYGAPAYGSEASYTARVIYKPTKVRGPEGNDVVAKGLVWISGTPTIDTEDRLTLPDGSTPPIMAVDRIPDEDGEHHVKVYFG